MTTPLKPLFKMTKAKKTSGLGLQPGIIRMARGHEIVGLVLLSAVSNINSRKISIVSGFT